MACKKYNLLAKCDLKNYCTLILLLNADTDFGRVTQV